MKHNLLKVALYARISTSNHGQDAEVQLRELREYCARRGFEIVAEYVDQARGRSPHHHQHGNNA